MHTTSCISFLNFFLFLYYSSYSRASFELLASYEAGEWTKNLCGRSRMASWCHEGTSANETVHLASVLHCWTPWQHVGYFLAYSKKVGPRVCTWQGSHYDCSKQQKVKQVSKESPAISSLYDGDQGAQASEQCTCTFRVPSQLFLMVRDRYR